MNLTVKQAIELVNSVLAIYKTQAGKPITFGNVITDLKAAYDILKKYNVTFEELVQVIGEIQPIIALFQ